MSKIETIKSYTGHDLENIFFRPMLTGPSAEELGIKVMYNMPVPTTLHFWKRSGDVLHKFDKAGWVGSAAANKYQKTLDLKRVKAEVGYSAEDYFSMVYELITASPNVNMEDLSGTELEAAETELFRRAIAESIRMNLWLGDKGGTLSTGYTSFDGLLKIVNERSAQSKFQYAATNLSTQIDNYEISEVLAKLIDNASPRLKGLFNDGQVAFFVSPKIFSLYQSHLDSTFGSAAYQDYQNGRKQLMFRGFPIIEVNLNPAIGDSDLSEDFIIFTDRRNLVMAVNTADSPGSEIRMWYNPDEMENRQRAVFTIGCDILDDELVCTMIDAE